MALHPDLVHMDRLDPDPAVWPTAIDGDDPRKHASAERGNSSIDTVCAYMAPKLRAALEALPDA